MCHPRIILVGVFENGIYASLMCTTRIPTSKHRCVTAFAFLCGCACGCFNVRVFVFVCIRARVCLYVRLCVCM